MKQNLDKFYTKPDIAEYCVKVLKDKVDIKPNDIYLEPSAGNGSFIPYLKDNKYVAYDIEPESEEIIKQDFLLFEPEYKDYIVIGNPPFGKRSRLAIDFLNHATSMAKVIGFIIPNTFLKWSVQKHINKNWKLIWSESLPSNAFTNNGSDFEANCVFQIWVRQDIEGEDLRLTSSPSIQCEDFDCWQYNATEEAKKYVYEDWDFAFWRQGYNDYNKYFTAKDRAQVIDIVENTKKQMFFVKCHTPKSKIIIENMDLNYLASSNLTTPGFGKADFILYYLELKAKF